MLRTGRRGRVTTWLAPVRRRSQCRGRSIFSPPLGRVAQPRSAERARRSGMRSVWLPVILLQMLVSTSSGLAGQYTVTHCLRATIESYPENEKRPVLSYMDEPMTVADEFVRRLD